MEKCQKLSLKVWTILALVYTVDISNEYIKIHEYKRSRFSFYL